MAGKGHCWEGVGLPGSHCHVWLGACSRAAPGIRDPPFSPYLRSHTTLPTLGQL